MDDEENHTNSKLSASKKEKTIESQRKGSQASSLASGDGKNRAQYDLPITCKIEMLKLARIEKLDDDFVLLAHPFPQMEGEMLLF
jgi:hypothetical protein